MRTLALALAAAAAAAPISAAVRAAPGNRPLPPDTVYHCEFHGGGYAGDFVFSPGSLSPGQRIGFGTRGVDGKLTWRGSGLVSVRLKSFASPDGSWEGQARLQGEVRPGVAPLPRFEITAKSAADGGIRFKVSCR